MTLARRQLFDTRISMTRAPAAVAPVLLLPSWLHSGRSSRRLFTSRHACSTMLATMRFTIASLLVLCGCGASQPAHVEAPTSPQTKTYAIRLSRPSHAGDREHLVVDLEEETLTTIARES